MTSASYSVKLRLAIFLIGSFMVASPSLQAASLYDSVLEIPRDSVFRLRYELQVPANREYMPLGEDAWQESLNEIAQASNDLNGVYLGSRGYAMYQHYLAAWQVDVDESYYNCLDRHRRIVRLDDGYISSNINIYQGDQNTNVIINNQSQSTPRYGSYQGFNTCIRPQHSMAVLMLDSDEVGSGGIFRRGYEFKVSSVRSWVEGDYYLVDISFDHPVATGIRIATTLHPDNVEIRQLNYSAGGRGFWQGLGNALDNISAISGDYFSVEFPSPAYFD